MMFVYTAMDRQGQQLTESLEAADLAAAQRALLERDLFVLRVEPGRGQSGGSAAGQGWSLLRRSAPAAPGARARELALFARQMSMMLRAGGQVVPALKALNEQPGRPAWHALLHDLVERVAGGAALGEALAHHPRLFPAPLRGIVAGGEATGTLGEAFQRLSTLLENRQRTRKKVLSALAYPALLLVMAGSVVTTLTTFVLPRFAQLFDNLGAPLPALTRIMLGAASGLKTWWPLALGLPLALLAAGVGWARSAAGRIVLAGAVLRTPLLGRTVASLKLAQLLQLWAALLRSRVPLLEAITQAQGATHDAAFLKLVDDIAAAVTEGRSMSSVMKQSGLVPAPIVSAIATGEESGRLAEAMDFVGQWLDEENQTLIASLTKVLEPLILVVMGLVVGSVCIALFLPLFDIAAAGR
jgi:type II secretory pathway component PulF